MSEDLWACVDASGEEYPEHTEDDVCRRCGAEMEVWTDE